MVGNVSRRIIAPLRHRQFFSLYEINQAIGEELLKLVNRPFQKMEGCRLTAFEKIDKPALQPLPQRKYEHCEWKETKVQFNYHVEYQGFFYSVHYFYVSQLCSVRATSKIIEIFIGHERAAAFPRNHNTFKRYTNLPEHMPEGHRAVAGWSPERFLSWVEKTGPNTREFIKWILDSREYPVQTYRTCMGIIRLGKSNPAEAMQTASREALERNAYSFKYFSILLKQAVVKAAESHTEKIIRHENVRGCNAFTGGGIHA